MITMKTSKVQSRHLHPKFKINQVKILLRIKQQKKMRKWKVPMLKIKALMRLCKVGFTTQMLVIRVPVTRIPVSRVLMLQHHPRNKRNQK